MIDPVSQVWTRQASDALREAAAAVRTGRADNRASLDPALLARPRHSYDQAIACGISVNLPRPWHKGNHPGLILARRLKRKALPLSGPPGARRASAPAPAQSPRLTGTSVWQVQLAAIPTAAG